MYPRRLGIGTTVAAVISVVLLIIGVVAGYFAGSAGAPSVTTTVTGPTTTVTGPTTTLTTTKTVEAGAPTTVTSTVTTTKTVTSTTTATAEPTKLTQYKDKIRIGTALRIETTMDPANAIGYMAVNILYNVGAGLVRYKAGTSEIEPDIASKWTISEDGTVYTFTLRQDAKFSNGNPVTAKTFEYSWRRALKLKGAPTFFMGLVIEKPEDVKAIDDYTLQVKLKHPFAPFLSLIAISAAPSYPVDPTVVSENDFYQGIYIGPGPYQISKYERDIMMLLTPNPYYFGPKPATPNIEIRWFSDSSALALALRNKDIDVVLRGGLSPSEITMFMQNPDFTVDMAVLVQNRMLMLNTAQPPFTDKRVRQAVAYAVDRRSIVETVFQNTVFPLYSQIPRGISGGANYFKSIYGDGNIEKAKELLRAAGYSESNKMKFELTYDAQSYGVTEMNVAVLFKQQIEATGMAEVKLNPVDAAKFTELYVFQPYPGLLQAFIFGWWADYLDADDYLYCFYNSYWAGILGVYLNNTRIDQLLEEQRKLVDFEDRLPLLVEIQKLGAEEASSVPLWQPRQEAVYIKGVEGVVLSPDGGSRYWLIRMPS